MIDRNLFCLYPKLLEVVKYSGKLAAPRKNKVLEVQFPLIWTLDRPQEWALFIPGRKLNPFFALAEVVWMWSGKGGAEFIQFYNKSITQFLDQGIPYFHGAYGKRVRHAGYNESPFRELPHNRTVGMQSLEVEVDQLLHVISKLQQEPETRQAVVSLWDPVKDNLVSSKDHPCNNILYFWIRNSALNMTVVRRSNDLIWGVPYNMIQFSHLQALVAGSLGVEVGQYHVMANNLHYYMDLYSETLEVVTRWVDNIVKRSGNLSNTSNSFYHRVWDMRWTLNEFDRFVNLEWDPFEKQSRAFIDQQVPVIREHANSDEHAHGTIDAFYNTRLMHMDHAFSEYHVPVYWRHLFMMLLAYHCRKAGAMEIFRSLVSQAPRAIQWLVADFYNKESE